MKILVINGPNLNMLGIREPDLYGKKDYPALERFIHDSAADLGVKVDIFQSNFEGEIITEIQKAYKVYDGIVINAGGYTHTSVAVLDALKAVGIRTVEVHISDVSAREDFRQVSYVGKYAEKTVAGLGFDGYIAAIDHLIGEDK